MKKHPQAALSGRCIAIIGSSKFLWAVIALLVLQAVWIALSGRYPMAFDEDFHFGLVQLYAHHLSPFWTAQPDGANAFGAVIRDPSYLYHYLFSFPYRLISLLTDSQTAQVIVLRFINIGLMATGVLLYGRLLLKAGASKAVVNLCLLVFVLLPITPLLAAQINYDNLFLPLVAISLLLVVRLDAELSKQKGIDVKALLSLLIICLATGLVKYAFLPIFLIIVGFLAVRIWLRYRSVGEIWVAALSGWRRLVGWSRLALVVVLVLFGGLFVERYGINLVRYHAPVADCAAVLSVEQCSEYGPWIRDYNLERNKTVSPHNPVVFANEWLYGMWLRTFFAVDGPTTGFQTRGPLLVPGLSAIALGLASAAALVVMFPRLLKKYSPGVIWLFAVVITGFVATLWLDGYMAFVRTGKAVAINGRYLLPIMPLLLLLGATAWNELLGGWRQAKLGFAAVAVLCMLWGGGALTYVLRSNDTWYWPGSITTPANHTIQKTLGPLTPGYQRPTQFLH